VASRRGNVTTDIGALGVYIDSFDLVLRVNGRSARTRELYADAARWFAGWLTEAGVRRWSDVGRDELRRFFLHLDDLAYSKAYRNQIGRSLQAFFKWLADEEELPNPFGQMKPPPPPKLGEKLSPVLAIEDLKRLVKDAESGRDFASRRDAALVRLFASTGCRLSEITHLQVDDVDVRDRTAVVTGKGSKTRKVRFDHKCALALDRYLRKRAEHPAAQLPALWIGVRRRMGMTPSGVRQVIERRGEALGLDIHPHLFRHTFSHNWLDQGGAEGDLMELNGWDSPQMLRHYGASARGTRARRAYDRVNVMGDV
jgi:site-specific recombinase XerD